MRMNRGKLKQGSCKPSKQKCNSISCSECALVLTFKYGCVQLPAILGILTYGSNEAATRTQGLGDAEKWLCFLLLPSLRPLQRQNGIPKWKTSSSTLPGAGVRRIKDRKLETPLSSKGLPSRMGRAWGVGAGAGKMGREGAGRNWDSNGVTRRAWVVPVNPQQKPRGFDHSLCTCWKPAVVLGLS